MTIYVGTYSLHPCFMLVHYISSAAHLSPRSLLHSAFAISCKTFCRKIENKDLPKKGGCGRRLLPESMSDRRLIDDLPEGTAGTSCTFFVFFGQPDL